MSKTFGNISVISISQKNRYFSFLSFHISINFICQPFSVTNFPCRVNEKLCIIILSNLLRVPTALRCRKDSLGIREAAPFLTPYFTCYNNKCCICLINIPATLRCSLYLSFTYTVAEIPREFGRQPPFLHRTSLVIIK